MARVRVVIVAGLGALFLALPPSAQAQGSAGEISGGYRLIHGADETFSLGWYADVLGNITDSFGVVADVAGPYKSIDETETVGGVQVNASGDLRIHTFMGGGVNIRATDSLSVRVAGSWFRVVEEDADNAFRFSLGVVFPFLTP